MSTPIINSEKPLTAAPEQLDELVFGVIPNSQGGEEEVAEGPEGLPPRSHKQRAATSAGTRAARFKRTTAETHVDLALTLDGSGQSEIATGIGFFDHMLTLFAKHSLIDLKVQAKGDLHVDPHHTVEDVGICLGKALVQALGDKSGIRRYGSFTLPMDETLVTAVVDLGGRPYFVWKAEVPRERLGDGKGDFPSELAEDFWQAVAMNGLMNLHVLCHYGRNTHHIIEGIFKAAARALRQAVEADPRMTGVPSTKGTLTQ